MTDSHLAIVTEYAALGDLAEFIEACRTQTDHPRGIPEAHARHLFQQLMLAVDFWWVPVLQPPTFVF